MRPIVPLLVAIAAVLPGAAAAGAVPRFDHVVVVVFENKERTEVIGNRQAPTFNMLARRYAQLTNYRAVAHPSLPNYLALVSGSTHRITTDCTACIVRAPSLADTLQRAGKTWKTYAEGLPSPGFEGAFAGRYAKKHDPFAYFESVTSRPAMRRRIVPLTRFRADVNAARLPSFSLVVPDLCHDMHDCPVAVGDAWLAKTIAPVLESRALEHSVVFVVFDEGTSSVGGGGVVAALALGSAVKAGARDGRVTSHYALLRTVEDAWNLPRLGATSGVSPITGIWR